MCSSYYGTTNGFREKLLVIIVHVCVCEYGIALGEILQELGLHKASIMFGLEKAEGNSLR